MQLKPKKPHIKNMQTHIWNENKATLEALAGAAEEEHSAIDLQASITFFSATCTTTDSISANMRKIIKNQYCIIL